MIIAVDFDGTCVKHKYPFIGEDIGAAPVLKKLVNDGHKIILNTMRSHMKTNIPDKHTPLGYYSVDTLQEAISWFEKNGIPLYGVNHNPDQDKWTDSQKPYANVYIDDAALGCPTIFDYESGRPFVDWTAVSKMLGYEKD